MKSWLIPLFEHMTHDATVSMKVRGELSKKKQKRKNCRERLTFVFFQGRQLLISLISNDTTEEFLRVAIPTLARLAVKSHIEIGETVGHFLR